VEKEWLAAVCSLAGVLGGKGLDWAIQRARQSRREEESAADRIERETTQFRQDLLDQVVDLRQRCDRVETENHRLDEGMIALKEELSQERIANRNLQDENDRLKRRVKELETQVELLQQGQVDVAKRVKEK
jgi:predicted RNase H-like nuclease (RuvC/YqgF family)